MFARGGTVAREQREAARAAFLQPTPTGPSSSQRGERGCFRGGGVLDNVYDAVPGSDMRRQTDQEAATPRSDRSQSSLSSHPQQSDRVPREVSKQSQAEPSRPREAQITEEAQLPQQELTPIEWSGQEVWEASVDRQGHGGGMERAELATDRRGERIGADDCARRRDGKQREPFTQTGSSLPAGSGQPQKTASGSGSGGSKGSGNDDAAAVPVSSESAPSPKPPRVPPGVQASYSLESLLGAGAFGTVWMASSRETGGRRAIKIVERKRQLHEDFSLEPAEAEILKQVSHPNIVQLIDLISTEACVYLVMELVLGGHLQAQLKAHGAYDEPRAKVLLQQVTLAVRHLHDRNIIHRDVKPENILFCDSGDPARPEGLRIKLTDFGLSTMKEGRLTTRCGTPSYCAPELLGGEGYGKAVDIWSIGVLAFVVVTGGLPFVGKNRHDLFARIQRGQYSFPQPSPGQELVTELAKDLISRLLKLEPMERYSTREALQHPWLCEAGSVTPPDIGEVQLDQLDTVHEMLRKFNAERRLRRAVHAVLACIWLQRAAQEKAACRLREGAQCDSFAQSLSAAARGAGEGA